MEGSDVVDRERAMRRYQRGESPTAICRSMGHSRQWFYKWLARFDAETDDWAVSQSRAPRGRPHQMSADVRGVIITLRQRLGEQHVFCGAAAIRWELMDLGVTPLPSLRTIARVLADDGLAVRRPGPYEPKGTRYPAPPAAHPSAVHQSDFVGPCRLRSAVRFYSLNTVDLATARSTAEPVLSRTAQETLTAFWASWQRLGVPRIQQVDNDPVFYGNRARPRGLGPLIRLCLLHDVEPWFIPVGEPWRNGVVEKFNHWWHQHGPLRHGELTALRDVHTASLAFEARHNAHSRYSKLHGHTPDRALTASGVPLRFPDAPAPRPPLPKPEHGRYHVVRLIRSSGGFDLFGERFPLPAAVRYEYVRATVDVGQQRVRFLLDQDVIEEQRFDLR